MSTHVSHCHPLETYLCPCWGYFSLGYFPKVVIRVNSIIWVSLHSWFATLGFSSIGIRRMIYKYNPPPKFMTACRLNYGIITLSYCKDMLQQTNICQNIIYEGLPQKTKVTKCLHRFSCNPNTADKSTSTGVCKIDCMQNDGGGDKKG